MKSKVDKMVNAWLHRHFFLTGRADVYITYIYPLILYRLSVLPITAKEPTKFQMLLSKQLWVRE